MPTNLAGLVLYILLLVPGLVFVFTREQHRPALKRSPFRETATIVFVSAVCVGAVLAVVAVVSLFWGGLRDVIVALALNDANFLAQNLPWLFLAGCALIALASTGGWALGTQRAHDLWAQRPWGDSLIPRDASAWGAAFGLAEINEEILIGVQLKSGWWMEGVLYAFDNAIDSEPTRTLTLTGAISSRAPTGELVHPVEGYGLLILQASEIDYLLVGYEHHKTLEGARRALARPKGIPRAGRAGKRPA